MPATYESIATTTVGSGISNVTFSSISGSFTDLILILSITAPGTAYIQVNGDTASNYSVTLLNGDGSSANSSRGSNQSFMYIAPLAGSGASPAPSITHFMNYSNTTTNKTVLTRSGEAGGSTRAYVNLWRSTAAINSIKVYLSGGGNFDSGSTFTLYGVKAA
jgi:hypothetical protein